MKYPKGTSGRRCAAAVVAVGVVTMSAACGSPSNAKSADAAAAIDVPLATSVTTSTGSWATLPMGHLDDPANTFWEVFTLPSGGRQWAEHTPPDVADNGGLVIAPTNSGVVIGFRPSDLLSFSPLASTTDGGATYTPGLLSGGLAAVPDALSVASTGGGAALTATGVLTSASTLSGWQPIATLSAIKATPAGQSCGVKQLSAVMTTGTQLYLGLACSSPGVVGLLERSGSAFVSAGVSLPAADPKAHVEVLRIVQNGQGIAALLGLHDGSATSYVAAWKAASGSTAWTTSSPLEAAGALTSTAVAAGGFAVLTKDTAGALHAAAIAQEGDGWSQLPTPPAGTATLSISTSRTDALVVDSATFTDYLLSNAQWVKAQTVQVAIPYGSSG